MTKASFERGLHAFSNRAPFRSYWIEFVSGDRIFIVHPESVVPFGELYLFRGPDRGQRLFEPQDVVQFIDPPQTAG